MTIARYFTAAVAALILFLPQVQSVHAQNYDIVILNGRVMDPETKFDGVRNVGIKGGKIVTITEDAINWQGNDRRQGSRRRPRIYRHPHAQQRQVQHQNEHDGRRDQWDWILRWGAVNIAAWYDREKGKWPMNYGQVVSHEMVRMMVHDGIKLDDPVDAVNVFDLRAESSKNDGVAGWSVTVSNLEQINEINRILDDNLRQGALGIGCTPGYASNGISTYEQFEVQRTASHYRRLCAFHTRFHVSSKPPNEATDGVCGGLHQCLPAEGATIDLP